MTLYETYTKRLESHSDTVLDMNGTWVWLEIVQCVTVEHLLSIDHFTIKCLFARPLHLSEATIDLVLETSLLFLC